MEVLQTERPPEATCPICGKLYPEGEAESELAALKGMLAVVAHQLEHIAQSLHRDEAMTQAMEQEIMVGASGMVVTKGQETYVFDEASNSFKLRA